MHNLCIILYTCNFFLFTYLMYVFSCNKLIRKQFVIILSLEFIHVDVEVFVPALMITFQCTDMAQFVFLLLYI